MLIAQLFFFLGKSLLLNSQINSYSSANNFGFYSRNPDSCTTKLSHSEVAYRFNRLLQLSYLECLQFFFVEFLAKTALEIIIDKRKIMNDLNVDNSSLSLYAIPKYDSFFA